MSNSSSSTKIRRRTIKDNLIEVMHHKKEPGQGTHQVTHTTKIILPKRYSKVRHSKPVEEYSSGDKNLIMMMQCSMQYQFIDQEERAE